MRASHGLGGWDEERRPDLDRRVFAVCQTGDGAGAGTGVPGTCGVAVSDGSTMSSCESSEGARLVMQGDNMGHIVFGVDSFERLVC